MFPATYPVSAVMPRMLAVMSVTEGPAYPRGQPEPWQPSGLQLRPALVQLGTDKRKIAKKGWKE